MAKAAELAPLERTLSLARQLAQHASAATRWLVRATALLAAQGKARTLRGLAATRALLVRFHLEGRQRAQCVQQALTARLKRQVVSLAAWALA